jgi:hypothetical protein
MRTLIGSGRLQPSGYVRRIGAGTRAAVAAGLRAGGLLLLALCPIVALAQEQEPPDGARISVALVSGIDLDRLSPGLREDIKRLAGTSLSRQLLRDLAARLEAEQPRYVTAVRITSDPGGEARVTFVVARIRDQGRDPNINTKYIVDSVDVRGVPQRDISPELWKELQSLVGQPLDSDAAERLGNQLRAEFPTYDLHRSTSRSSEQGRIKLVYFLRLPEWARWLRFEPIDANALYHSDQGWGALLPLTMSSRDVRVTPILAWDHADEVVEEYGGFAVRVESRKLGTERVGMFFEWSTYDQEWRDATLAALALNPQIARPYRNRMSFTPLGKVALTPHLSVAGGVGITELDPLDEELGLSSQMANVAVGSVRYKQLWGSGPRFDQQVGAAFTLRAGTPALQSDFEYERYLGEAAYQYRQRGHMVQVAGMFGRINGTAPLFERFSLGDSRTLRGWDKYDINPAGGDRMFHSSVEYHYHGLLLFLDAGSVWDPGTDMRMRFSTGAGFTPGPVFFILGFPLNTDEFRAVFTMGFRFGTAPLSLAKY